MSTHIAAGSGPAATSSLGRQVSNLAWIWGSHWRPFSATIAVGVLQQVLHISFLALSAYIVGEAATGASTDDLRRLVILLAVLVVPEAICAYLTNTFFHIVAFNALHDLRIKVFAQLERLAPAYLLERRSGDVGSALMADIELLELFFAHGMGAAIIAVIAALFGLVVLAFFHPLLALVYLPFVILVMTIPAWLHQRAEDQGRRTREQVGAAGGDLVDMVQGLREVLAFGAERERLQLLTRRHRDLRRAQVGYASRMGLEFAALDFFIACGMVAVLATAGWLAADGRIDESLVATSAVLAVATFFPITQFSSAAFQVGQVSAASERVHILMETLPRVEDAPGVAAAIGITPSINFEDVHFRYGPDLPLALDGASFAVSPGETLALVGKSGAGKSTCVSLLFRWWDVESGRIRIGDRDIREMPQGDLRTLMSLVPQDVYLFNLSVYENIALGRPEATRDEVEQAAELALIKDFIESLPEGWNTVLGERGTRLSGGQRQRIAIARALLKDSPILVFDEAVSNLDAESEVAIQEALRRIRHGKTMLIIAHRLSTIRSADRIVVIEDGRAAEAGTHEELITRGGAYARLLQMSSEDDMV